MTNTFEAIKVRVENLHEMPAAAAAAPQTRLGAMYETVVLTANDPVQCILPEDPNRKIAFVQPLDNDIVIGTKAQVQAAANTIASVPQPSGAYLPKSNAAPVPVIDTNAVFAGVTTTASNSRVSVQAVTRIPG